MIGYLTFITMFYSAHNHELSSLGRNVFPGKNEHYFSRNIYDKPYLRQLFFCTLKGKILVSTYKAIRTIFGIIIYISFYPV